MKRILIILFLFSQTAVLNAQEYNSIFRNEMEISQPDSNKLFLRIENTNLFKNNEYFNKIEEGYTLLGYFLRPQLVYYSSSNTKIEAGVHLLKYSGIESYSKVLPTFRFHYQADSYDIILGNLYGTINHGVIEPLFKFERYFENNIENGVQILIDKKRFTSDIWLNWENFIFHGDSSQERFTLGNSSKLELTNSQSRTKVFIPFQMIATHRGGQINITDERIQSLLNTATGLGIEHSVNGKVIKSVGLYNYYTTYQDLSPAKQLAFNDGHGFYSKVFLNTRFVNLMAGYWNATDFIAPKGSPLFQSVSYFKNDYVEPEREMLNAKLIYEKEICDDITLGVRFESYYDLLNRNFDYSYGIHILFNRDFFLKKIE